jgi:hypothetical protein
MTFPKRFCDCDEALHAAARGATGLEDFGPEAEYRPGLARLLDALDHDGPRFAPGGREFVFGNLVGVLVARLTTQRGLRDRPDALQRPINRPLVITGVPRTGTTALHKLLSVDPQFQGLERWLTAFPMPRPPRATWAAHPSYQATVAGIEAFFAGAPDMRAAHDMVADDVDECLEVLKQNFCSNNYGSTFRVPGYDAWWSVQDEVSSYWRFAQVLQLVGVDEPGKPWLLKNPGHIWELDVLLELFPDACIVQTHRDPVQALPSLCSVLAMARGLTEGGNVVLRDIGEREIANWHAAVTRAMAVRERAPGQFIDVRHKDFHKDPMDVVRRIYERFGYTLTDDVEQRMKERIQANPEGRHGTHVYTLEQFGLQAGAIRERFGKYMQHYDLA